MPHAKWKQIGKQAAVERAKRAYQSPIAIRQHQSSRCIIMGQPGPLGGLYAAATVSCPRFVRSFY
jgi:hypothetical protein